MEHWWIALEEAGIENPEVTEPADQMKLLLAVMPDDSRPSINPQYLVLDCFTYQYLCTTATNYLLAPFRMDGMTLVSI